jgi:hypothetical protein
MTSYDKLIDLEDVGSIQDLLQRMSSDLYEESDGSYSAIPTWGPETKQVTQQINASCAEGDIVSWDTRSKDAAQHIYLRRAWSPATNHHRFYLISDHDRLLNSG